MRIGRDGSVDRSRAGQHVQKVRRCLSIIIPPCQVCEEGHVEPGHLPPSTLLGVEDQLMAIKLQAVFHLLSPTSCHNVSNGYSPAQE